MKIEIGAENDAGLVVTLRGLANLMIATRSAAEIAAVTLVRWRSAFSTLLILPPRRPAKIIVRNRTRRRVFAAHNTLGSFVAARIKVLSNFAILPISPAVRQPAQTASFIPVSDRRISISLSNSTKRYPAQNGSTHSVDTSEWLGRSVSLSHVWDSHLSPRLGPPNSAVTV